ncbi:MAG: hypothetical protein V4725_04530 [Bacteroidota bacterium]|nr:hypothetical protein [Ferruginibacter sp.]
MNKIFLPIIISCCLGSLVFYSCTKENAGKSDNSAGKAGSLTRFTITGNYLYAVDNHFLYAYSLANPKTPEKVFNSQLNFDIETIYGYKNNLFLGTKTGLYIYSIDTPAAPRLVGQASHARACDPVVANDSVAFVTLKGWGNCGPATSGLYVHDITDITKPLLKTTVELPDPVGLGLQDSVLYVCCGTAGLKVFNVARPYSPKLLSTKNDGVFVDVIPYNNTLICYVESGILLYDISKPAEPVLVKSIAN